LLLEGRTGQLGFLPAFSPFHSTIDFGAAPAKEIITTLLEMRNAH
jgi:hypothetical protein